MIDSYKIVNKHWVVIYGNKKKTSKKFKRENEAVAFFEKKAHHKHAHIQEVRTIVEKLAYFN